MASNPLCRRLELKDFLPTAMQRLTKYPLLIDNLLKYTQREYRPSTPSLPSPLPCSMSTGTALPLPTAMQRLTKYPLLIDNLLKYTQREY